MTSYLILTVFSVADIISRPDSRDATCASAERRDRVRDLQHARFPERPWESLDDSNITGLRVGVPQVSVFGLKVDVLPTCST